MRLKTFFAASFLVFAFVSCKKTEPYTQSSNSVVYENEGYINITEEQVALEARIYVENASPYEDMLGYVSWEAFSSSIGGNDVRVSDIAITNIKLETLEFQCPFNADSLLLYLESVNVFMEYYDGGNGTQKLQIGSMILVDVANRLVRFLPTEDDLTTFMEHQPDRIYFDLKFRFKPYGPLDVKYKVAFSYDYYYESSEDKN